MNSYTRRKWLWEFGGGAMGLGLAQLMHAAQQPHFAPKAKRIILINMIGGVSQVDTFDYKPELQKNHGKATTGANTITPFFGKGGTLMKSPWAFKQYGQTGKWVSDLMPHLAQRADDMTFFHAMVSRSNAHGPAIFQMSTGYIFQGFPSVGSWISYGLGSENENLPSFVVLPDPRGLPACGVANWGSGFLPAAHQGVIFGGETNPVADLRPPKSVTDPEQAASYDLLTRINQEHLRSNPGDDVLVARIKAYELAARMQLSAPEVTSIAGESEATRESYGLNDPVTRPHGYNCLLARRLLERGVRCVQLFNGGDFGAPRINWDAHEDLVANHEKNARVLDRPTAALLADLKQRGMLADTLVAATTEFGRLPISQGFGEGGRDHNPEGFTAWMAGAGLRAGLAYGSTDELGYKAVEHPTTIYDFHATILHLLGIDHTRLTYYHNGLQRRLTDVHGHVVKDVLA